MNLSVDDTVFRAVGELIVGNVDGYTYVFNPRGHSGVVPLSQRARDVFECCIMGLSFSDTRRCLPWAKAAPWKLADKIIWLGSCGILDLGPAFSQDLAAQREQKSKRALNVWLQMTDACNLQCSYCYVPKKTTHMEIETGKELISKIVEECREAEYDSVLFKFAGGEPIIAWETIKGLIDWAHTWARKILPKVEFLILTNGTYLPSDVIDYATSGKIRLAISLDGVQQWHDKHRAYPNGVGSFRDVDRNIELLLRHGVRPSISATITRENVRGLTELAEYCIHRDLHFRFSPYRRPLSGQLDLTSDNAELTLELRRCYEWIESHLPTRSLYDMHRFADINLKRPKSRICGIGNNMLAISSLGDMCLCQFDMANPIGSALEEDVMVLLQKQKRFPVKENRVDRIPVCKDCKWRFTCAGGCPYLAERQFGAFRHPSPYCEVYKAILPVLLRLHALQSVRTTIPGLHDHNEHNAELASQWNRSIDME